MMAEEAVEQLKMSRVSSLERVTLAAKHTYAWFGVRPSIVPGEEVASIQSVEDGLHAVADESRHCTL